MRSPFLLIARYVIRVRYYVDAFAKRELSKLRNNAIFHTRRTYDATGLRSLATFQHRLFHDRAHAALEPEIMRKR